MQADITTEQLRTVLAKQDSRTITYEDMTIIAPTDDIRESLDYLKELNWAERRHVMASVNARLAANAESVKYGTATQRVAMEFMQDMTIWFANEVLAKRAILETY
jgi:hypothetical protein